MEIKTKERSEIEEKYKWDLSIIYKSIEEWEKDFATLEVKIKDFGTCKGTLTTSADSLLASLQKRDEIARLYEKLSSYAVRKSDEDTRDSGSDKLKNKIATLGTDFNELASFFEPELMQLDIDKLNLFIKENKDLEVYKHYLDNIFRFKEHTLSPDEEKIMASASEVLSSPSKIFGKLNDADIKFGFIKDDKNNKVELSKSNYVKYVSSQNRSIRKKAYNTLYQGYKEHRNTFAETLTGDIKANYFVSKNRKYKNPLEMSLYHNNINVEVYDNVIETVHNNLDKMYKYIKMKKSVLGLKKMYMYDLYVDLIKEYDVEYKYEDALALVFKALEPLGEEYISNAKKAFDNRWIDVFENAGKRSGAYSSFGYDTPPYILLNYNGKLHSVSTIIHELGHSMHTYYSAKNQPYIYHEYSIFLAEIASNVNEMLLNMYMLDHAKDKQERLSLINSFLESVRASIYRQVMFAEFEKKIYDMEGRKEPITEEVLSNLYFELNKKYYGDNISYDEHIKYEWMRIPHFYYQFYVYQYATGLTAAFFIAKDLYEGKEGMREKYIKFLSGGSSEYPLDLLRGIGINMTNGEAMNRILKYFDEQIDEFIKVINEK